MDTSAGPVTSTEMRPMTVGEIFGEAWKLYTSNFVLLISVAAIALIPAAILNGIGFGLQFIGTILTIAATGALVWTVSHRYRGHPVDGMLQPYQAIGWLRLLYLVVDSIIYGIAIGIWFIIPAIVIIAGALGGSGGVVAFGFLLGLVAAVPAAFFAVKLAFFWQAILIEGADIGGGISRSWNLTSGHFWRVLGVGVLIVLVQIVVAGLTQLIFGRIRFIGPASGTIVDIFLYPFVYGAATMLYYDIRFREEGVAAGPATVGSGAPTIPPATATTMPPSEPPPTTPGPESIPPSPAPGPATPEPPASEEPPEEEEPPPGA